MKRAGWGRPGRAGDTRFSVAVHRVAVFRRRFLGVIALVLGLWAIGTAGFALIGGWSFSDAAFMTVITLTAVGYEEVRPLDDAGRLLATFLLVGGITCMGLWFALITSAIVEMDLAHVFRTRRTMKSIEKLKDHTIVCGAGRTGRQVIKELVANGTPYVVIEVDPARADQIRETARDLQPNLTIVARAFDEETMNKLHRAGADHVVSPNISGGVRMASVLLRPQVMSFLDVVTRAEELALRLEEVAVPEGSPLAGQSLAEARIRERTGLIVIAIRHDAETRDGAFRYNPGPEESIRPLDTLIVLGEPDQVDRLRGVARG